MNLITDTLYNNSSKVENEKIYKIDTHDIEIESDVSSLQFHQGRSQIDKNYLQSQWVSSIKRHLESVASYDPRPVGTNRQSHRKLVFNKLGDKSWSQVEEFQLNAFINEPPTEIIGAQGAAWSGGVQGVDMRPHYRDPDLQQEFLVDSGSQVTAVAPEPGDKESESVFLRAVNGSKIKTFGHKNITIRIGRKQYHFKAIIAQVESPVLGWDFMRQHKLDLRWGDFGDLLIAYAGFPAKKKERMLKR